jgi:Domain of unknown function (DUF4976)
MRNKSASLGSKLLREPVISDSVRAGPPHSRRAFIRSAAAAGSVVLGSTLFGKAPASTKLRPRPNIVFFLGEGAVPNHFQGKSLMPLAAQQQITWREDWLYEYYEYPGYQNVKPCRGVRTERYKYIHYFTAPQEFELYDLKTDADELDNLYGDPKSAALTAKLAARLEELRRETNDHYEYVPTVPIDDHC